jgi:hypothetical protein
MSPLHPSAITNDGKELQQGAFSVAHESGKHAVSGASKAAAIDPDLAEVIARWPTLPEALRSGIVALFKAAGR